MAGQRTPLVVIPNGGGGDGQRPQVPQHTLVICRVSESQLQIAADSEIDRVYTFVQEWGGERMVEGICARVAIEPTSFSSSTMRELFMHGEHGFISRAWGSWENNAIFD